jgi:hypothetical protein
MAKVLPLIPNSSPLKNKISLINMSLKCEFHKLKAQILTTQSRELGTDGDQLTKDN